MTRTISALAALAVSEGAVLLASCWPVRWLLVRHQPEPLTAHPDCVMGWRYANATTPLCPDSRDRGHRG